MAIGKPGRKSTRQKIEERDREENGPKRGHGFGPKQRYHVMGYEVRKEVYYLHLRTFGTPNYKPLVPKYAIERDEKGHIVKNPDISDLPA